MKLSTGKHTVLIIPDMQCPFEHKDSIPFLRALRRRFKPTKIICIGDSMDAHALSRWAHDPDGMGAGAEYLAAIESLQRLYKLFPDCQEVMSNHNERVAKRVFDAGIPAGFLRTYEEIMQYPPGWSIQHTVTIDGVIYEHGHSQGGMYAARNLAYHNGCSTVIGHHHSHAGVNYIANRQKMYFGMNVGCLIDIDAYAFAYAKEAKFKPTLGAGAVIKGVPYFVPMLLDSRKRWTGDIIL